MSSPIQVYYDNQQLVPGPTVSINKEFIYANDVITGYTYVFNLQGYASSINTKNGNTSSSLKNTIQSLDDIKNILHQNGKIFRLFCPNSAVNLVIAYGGHLRSFEVSETENRWVQYAKYSAQIEFTRVIFNGATNVEIAPDSQGGGDGFNSLAPELLRLKNYSDNWNFTMSEDDLYKYYIFKDMIEDYSQIEVEYTITAVGKHYYDDNTLQTKPAWVHAKEFVQKKLYDQLRIFKNASPLGYYNFPNSSYTSEELVGSPTLSNASSSFTGAVSHPILGSSLSIAYKIFNEKINCSTSEAEGKFSATYTCILKQFNTGDKGMDYATHTFDVSYDKVRNTESTVTTVSVNGTITGILLTAIETSAIDGQMFMLPNNGPFLYAYRDTGNKYFNALNSFNNYIANADHSDLQEHVKQRLDINYATLFPDTTIATCIPQSLNLTYAQPRSFSVTHNYADGSLNYNAEYDTDRSCSVERGFETLTITEEDSVPIIAEFVIPGRSQGPILQYLKTHTHKKVTLEFTGTTRKGCDTGTPWDDIAENVLPVCGTDEYIHLPTIVTDIIHTTEEYANQLMKQTMIPVSNNQTYNPIDGSFTLSRTYIVCPYDPESPLGT